MQGYDVRLNMDAAMELYRAGVATTEDGKLAVEGLLL